MRCLTVRCHRSWRTVCKSCCHTKETWKKTLALRFRLVSDLVQVWDDDDRTDISRQLHRMHVKSAASRHYFSNYYAAVLIGDITRFPVRQSVSLSVRLSVCSLRARNSKSERCRRAQINVNVTVGGRSHNVDVFYWFWKVWSTSEYFWIVVYRVQIIVTCRMDVMQITHTEFGSAVTHSLKDGGENVPVTNSNRHGSFSTRNRFSSCRHVCFLLFLIVCIFAK